METPLKVWALTTNQGTAMPETALTDDEYKVPHLRAAAIAQAALSDDWSGSPEFVDASGNDVLVDAVRGRIEPVAGKINDDGLWESDYCSVEYSDRTNHYDVVVHDVAGEMEPCTIECTRLLGNANAVAEHVARIMMSWHHEPA